MAKKKANKVQKVEEPRATWSRKPLVLQMRGNPEWKAWLERFAKDNGMTVATFVEFAIRVAARQIKPTEEPPER